MLIEPKDFWKRLLKKYFIDSPKVTVMGKASKKEQEELTRMENERIAKQIEALGPEGLGVKHKILTEAIKINEIQPPVEVLTKLPIPDTNKISFHSIKSYTSDFKDNEKINFFNKNSVTLTKIPWKILPLHKTIYISLLMTTEITVKTIIIIITYARELIVKTI